MIDKNGKIILIRHAVEDDIDRIFEIANEQKAEIDDSGRIKRPGLVSSYSKEVYKDCIKKSSYFFVLIQDKVVTSFLLGFKSTDDAPESIKLDEICKILVKGNRRDESNFILVKQICTAKVYTGRWHARMLYQMLKTLRRTEPIYAAIVISSPPNISSIRLHEDCGFIRVFEFGYDDIQDKFKRAFWCCSSINDKEKKIDLLLHQHSIAADLYQHEDNLNWRKISTLFYISSALIAGIVILLKQNTGQPLEIIHYYMILMLGIFGLCISIFFRIALQSGVKYMLCRKQSLIDIDSEFAKLNGIRMFVPIQASPTAKWIRLIPYSAIFLWGLVVLVASWKIFFYFFNSFNNL